MTPAEKSRSVLADRLHRLDLIGRLVLSTDGTVTPMLEHIVGEPIITARIDQHCTEGDPNTRNLLQVPAEERLLSRSLDLVGSRTATVYVQARSVIVPRVLPMPLRHALLRTREPIGVLLRRQQVETFRELLACEVYDQPRGGEPRSPWASREYRVFIGGVPALLISERFAASCLRGPAA